MSRLLLPALLLVVAAWAAPLDSSQDTQAAFQLLRSLNPADVQKVKEIVKDLDLSRNQKEAAVADVVAGIKDPAQKAAAAKLKEILHAKHDAIKARLQSTLATLSPGAQAVGRSIGAALQERDTPMRDVLTKVKAAFDAAPPSVQAELRAAKEATLGNLKQKVLAFLDQQ